VIFAVEGFGPGVDAADGTNFRRVLQRQAQWAWNGSIGMPCDLIEAHIPALEFILDEGKQETILFVVIVEERTHMPCCVDCRGAKTGEGVGLHSGIPFLEGPARKTALTRGARTALFLVTPKLTESKDQALV
jgi:hypothetical protein